MRQSDGSEILGPNDPRNLVIGIIHVSPSDDRQSVVTAITTQDKLGRDQIVLDLPAQNRSFKNAVDFEGLRQMASEIEATLVLVTPQKSKIANLARREHFTTYPSLEELTAAEFPPLEPDGTGEQAANSNGAQDADADADHTMIFPIEMQADSAPQTPQPGAQETPVATQPPPAQDSQANVPTANLPRVNAPEEDVTPTDPSLPVANAPEQVQAAPDEDDTPTDPSLASPDTSAQSQTAQGSNLPAVVPANSNALVPSNPQLPVYYEPIEPPRRRSWRGWIIAGVIILLLIALIVLFNRPVLDLFFPPAATVTITPDSQRLQHTYQITAVLGVPDPTKNQVDARALYADSQTQTQTVKATGQGHTAGQQARGTLTLYNTSSTQQTVQAGTIIFDQNGLAVVNDAAVTLPALDTSVGLSSRTVAAHTVNVGRTQNIPAYDFDSQICCGGGIYVSNTEPFSGGQDSQTFTYVQQSDIDGVTQSLQATLAQQATTTLQGQVRANEKPAGAPKCAPQVQSDHQAGDRASTVTVSVKTSCAGEVYDMQAVQVLAARKLTQDAATNPGPSYVPVGSILTQVTQATPDNHGNIPLLASASGVWAYQFTDAQRAHLASLIANQSEQDARTLLLKQAGVHGVTITLTGVNATTIPGETRHITINIEAVQGLHT